MAEESARPAQKCCKLAATSSEQFLLAALEAAVAHAVHDIVKLQLGKNGSDAGKLQAAALAKLVDVGGVVPHCVQHFPHCRVFQHSGGRPLSSRSGRSMLRG